jgi:dihydrofolate reductase
MSGIRIAMVAAVAENGVIGQSGTMPWRLRSDMQRFRRITLGKPVIMGRKTFETIGKPLDGRVNIVVTRRPGFARSGMQAVPTMESAISHAEAEARAAGVEEVMVIGGGEIYAAAMPFADRLYITHVEASPEGDVHFPDIDAAVWQPVATESVPMGPNDSAATRFVVYERTPAPSSHR